MKKTLLAATVLVAFFAVSCGGANSTKNTESAVEAATEEIVVIEEEVAVDSAALVNTVDSLATAMTETVQQ